MVCYSVQPGHQIFSKGCRFWFFATNRGNSIGKNVSKSLSSNYRLKPLDLGKQAETDAFNTASERAIRNTAEATGFKKVSKNSQ